ncbi:unnamed protein product [Cuscuta epithymum]|uniref:Retrotransposon gag domain-containing protein n=1 Tax=Cuscuta epithymum TaxID=186058 RepID=A0AAV0D851_9ASTE|nr:unnamed protein product [Cuscuta epithymum]
MVDGSIQVPPPYSIDVLNRQSPNPEFSIWLRIDQTIRSCLFATLYRDVLINVRELKHYYQIWERLESRFMSASLARSMELKRLFSQIKKKPEQSMDRYLREIKSLFDDLATINCPASSRELLKITIMGLGPEYESLLTTVSLSPQNFPFETLRNHLLEQEQRVLYPGSQDSSSMHHAFAASAPYSSSQTGPQQGGSHQVQQPPVGKQQQPRYSAQQHQPQRGRGRGRGRGWICFTFRGCAIYEYCYLSFHHHLSISFFSFDRLLQLC